MTSLHHVLDGEFVVCFYFSTVFLHSKGHPIMWGWHTSGHPSRPLIPLIWRASDSSVSTPTAWKATCWEPLQHVSHSGMEVRGTSVKRNHRFKKLYVQIPNLWRPTGWKMLVSWCNFHPCGRWQCRLPTNTCCKGLNHQNTKNVPFSRQRGWKTTDFGPAVTPLHLCFLNGWILVWYNHEQ